MASSTATAAVRHAPRPERDARALLVCSRPDASAGANEELLVTLDGELAARLAIERCSPPEAARRLRTWVSATQPTLLLVRDGIVVAVAVGALSRLELERLIRHAIL